MSYLLKRLREPSTWAGIGVLTAVIGLPPEMLGMVQQIVMGAAGLYAVLASDKPAP